MVFYLYFLCNIICYINSILNVGAHRVNYFISSPLLWAAYPLWGAICLQWGYAHAFIFSWVREFGWGPSQFGVVVVWPSPFGIFQEHIGIFQEYIRIFQEYILRFQKENIILRLETKEASICKTGFPKQKVPRTFYKEKSPIFSYEVGPRPLFWWKVHN